MSSTDRPDPRDLAVAYYVTVMAALVADEERWADGFGARLRARVAERASSHDVFFEVLVRELGFPPHVRRVLEAGAPWTIDDYDARSAALELGLFTRLRNERPIAPARVVAEMSGPDRVALGHEAIEHAVRVYLTETLRTWDASRADSVAAALADALEALLPEASEARASVARGAGLARH